MKRVSWLARLALLWLAASSVYAQAPQVAAGSVPQVTASAEASAGEITPEQLATWGVLALLADSTWGKSSEPTSIGTLHVIDTFSWVEGRRALKIECNSFGMIDTWLLRPGKVPGELLAEVTSPLGTRSKTTWRVVDANTVASDWYKVAGKVYARAGFTLNADADKLMRLDVVSQDGSRPALQTVSEETFRLMGWSQMSGAKAAAMAQQAGATWRAQLAKAEEERKAEEARKAAERREERAALFGALATGTMQGLSQAADEYRRDRAQQDAFLADTAAQVAAIDAQRHPEQQAGTQRNADQAGQGSQVQAMDSAQHSAPRPSQQPAASTRASDDASPAAVKPLRFVLTVGLQPQAGDTTNPSCLSNVITRPGPPGWGAPGFLPTGTAEQAIQTIESLKAAFFAKCRATSGREIAGTLNHNRNQSDRDEAELDTWGRRGDGVTMVQMD